MQLYWTPLSKRRKALKTSEAIENAAPHTIREGFDLLLSWWCGRKSFETFVEGLPSHSTTLLELEKIWRRLAKLPCFLYPRLAKPKNLAVDGLGGPQTSKKMRDEGCHVMDGRIAAWYVGEQQRGAWEKPCYHRWTVRKGWCAAPSQQCREW